MKKNTKKSPPKLSLYASGEGRNISGGGTVSLQRKKTTLSGTANFAPGYAGGSIGVERRVNKNLTLGAQLNTDKSYNANVRLNIPIGKTKSKKKK